MCNKKYKQCCNSLVMLEVYSEDIKYLLLQGYNYTFLSLHFRTDLTLVPHVVAAPESNTDQVLFILKSVVFPLWKENHVTA